MSQFEILYFDDEEDMDNYAMVFMTNGNSKLTFIFSEWNVLEAKMIVDVFNVIVNSIKDKKFMAESIMHNVNWKIGHFTFTELTFGYYPETKTLDVSYGDTHWDCKFEIEIDDQKLLEIENFLNKLKNKFNKFDEIIKKNIIESDLISKINSELENHGYKYNGTMDEFINNPLIKVKCWKDHEIEAEIFNLIVTSEYQYYCPNCLLNLEFFGNNRALVIDTIKSKK